MVVMSAAGGGESLAKQASFTWFIDLRRPASYGPAHGTTVKIYLPRFTGPEGVPAASEDAGRVEPPRGAGETILVVEDDERVREVSVEALRDLGYTVLQAADANQALAMLALQPSVDLLFTDVVMPDMNGRQLAEKARAAYPSLTLLYT